MKQCISGSFHLRTPIEESIEKDAKGLKAMDKEVFIAYCDDFHLRFTQRLGKRSGGPVSRSDHACTDLTSIIKVPSDLWGKASPGTDKKGTIKGAIIPFYHGVFNFLTSQGLQQPQYSLFYKPIDQTQFRLFSHSQANHRQCPLLDRLKSLDPWHAELLHLIHPKKNIQKQHWMQEVKKALCWSFILKSEPVPIEFENCLCYPHLILTTTSQATQLF